MPGLKKKMLREASAIHFMGKSQISEGEFFFFLCHMLSALATKFLKPSNQEKKMFKVKYK